MEKLIGLIAAPFTGFDANGEVNLSIIERQAELLTANGVRGAFVCGTTGECGSLTLDERMRIAERWCEAARVFNDFKVVVHVGHSCLKDSQTLAAHAAKSGAFAVAALAPYYFKPTSAETIVQHCREIAHYAPGLPFYYYHMPSITGVTIPAIEILRALDNSIPNFAGIKFTHEDLFDFGLSTEFENRRYDILCGRDESLLAGLSLGAVGAVGSTYNYMAPVYNQIMESFERGDLRSAQSAQERVRQTVDLMIRFGGMAAGKAIMRMIGVDCGSVRLPLVELSIDKYKAFEKALDNIGFFESCSKI